MVSRILSSSQRMDSNSTPLLTTSSHVAPTSSNPHSSHAMQCVHSRNVRTNSKPDDCTTEMCTGNSDRPAGIAKKTRWGNEAGVADTGEGVGGRRLRGGERGAGEGGGDGDDGGG